MAGGVNPRLTSAMMDVRRRWPELAEDREVAYRASMLPIGNYEDGSIAFPVWPQSAVDAYEALGRFGRGEPPQPQDAVLAGLAMAGSGLGHLGLRSAARAVSGKALEGVEASRPLTSHSVEAENPAPTRFVSDGAGGFIAAPTPRVGFYPAEPPAPVAPVRRSSSFKGPRGLELYEVSPGDFNIMRDGRTLGFVSVDIRNNTARINDIDVAEGANSLGVAGLRDLREAFRQAYPDVVHFESFPSARISGARWGPAATGENRTQKVTLFSNPKEAAPAGMVPASSPERQGIRAYHGSPFDFDKFDSSKIGTGEGANAYGRGLYFVDSEDVARRYRDAVTGYNNRLASEDPSSGRTAVDSQGKMYEVNLNIDRDRILDLDLPLAQQSPYIQNALRGVSVPDNAAKIAELTERIESGRGGFATSLALQGLKDQERGAGFYNRLRRGHDETAPAQLLDVGVPAVRYTDEVVDGVGDGAKNNYVVFDDSLIDILRKYANPPEAAPAGLLATSSLDRMAADEAVKPRPFPDAPLTYPELEEFVRTNRGGYSSSRADQAWREDPYRYDAYGRGLHDVLNPESMWFTEGPTLQSGGLAGFVPTAGTPGIDAYPSISPIARSLLRRGDRQ